MGTRFATTGPEGPQLGADDAANLRTQFNALRDDLIKVVAGDYLITTPTLAIGSNKDDVANAAFTYVINGIQYQKAAVTTGTGPGDDVVPENATGYASAALAIAGIAAKAATKVRMGTVTAIGSAAAFTFGTTLLDAANTTVAYTDDAVFGLDASLTSDDLTRN